jgi:hypothetical protein
MYRLDSQGCPTCTLESLPFLTAAALCLLIGLIGAGKAGNEVFVKEHICGLTCGSTLTYLLDRRYSFRGFQD